jgi:hypothetical protein
MSPFHISEGILTYPTMTGKQNKEKYGSTQCDQTENHSNNVNTTGFRVPFLFVWLLSIVDNFLYACSGNCSIAVTRNAWVGNLVCLCVMENRNYTKQWMVERVTPLKKGLCNSRWKVR